MPIHDPAKAIKNALAAKWAVDHPAWTATLEVADDYQPIAGSPTLLVADDGGPRIFGGPWLLMQGPSRITIRLTAFAAGRTEARDVVVGAAEDIVADRPAVIARIENVSNPLETKDRATGAYLASITMPVVVRSA